jgi:hypothetical protein
MGNCRSVRRAQTVGPVRVFSGLVHAVHAQPLRASALVALITRSGYAGRPELFRETRDARSVSLRGTTIVCIARANNSALPPALRCGKRGANTNHRSVGENEAVATEAENFGGNPGAKGFDTGTNERSEQCCRRSIRHEQASKRICERQRRRSGGLAAQSRRQVRPCGSLPAQSQQVVEASCCSASPNRAAKDCWESPASRPKLQTGYALRARNAQVGLVDRGSIPRASTDGNRAGVLRSRRTARHYSPQHLVIAQRGSRPFRTVSRATARRRRAATSTSTVATKPALSPLGAVAARQAHNLKVAGAIPAGATSARKVFVARVRAETFTEAA